MPDAWSAAGSGVLAGAEHHLPVRVYWEDTDGSGIVYHASYLRFAERARTELLRLAGGHQRQLLQDEGVAFPVRRLEIDYLKPAFLDDALDVATRVAAAGGASIDLAQSVRRDEEILARLQVRVACIDRTGRPTRIPPAIRAALAETLAPGKVTTTA